jgi:hypothetical protein
MQKVIFEKTETFLDHKTGEIHEEINYQTIKIPKEPPFVKLYLEDLIKLNNLPKSNSSVLYELVKLVNYDGEINLSPFSKERIVKILKIKNPKSLDNSIQQLVKTDIMKRIGRGCFLLNPSLFAKGSWSDIRRLREKYIELKITYNNNGKKDISVTIKDK